jgi:hypothetical protein
MLASLVFDSEADEEWLERKIAMLDDIVNDSLFYRRIDRKARLEEISKVILNVVQMRFPDLVELAKQQVIRIQDLTVLEQVSMQIIMARSREEAERSLLEWQGQQDTSENVPD